MFVAAEVLLLGRSVIESVGGLAGFVGWNALQLEGAELLIDNLPYYLVGRHGE